MKVAFIASASLMIALALSWLLRPLVSRVDAPLGCIRRERRKTNLALLAIVPSAAVALYASLGRFDAIEPPIDADGALEALAIAANEAVERDDPDAAIRYWTRLRALVPAGSAVERSLQRNIAEAGERAAAGRSGR